MRFTNKERILAVFVIILVLGFILYGLAYKHIWKEIRTLRFEVMTKKAELGRLSSLETNVDRINREIYKLDSKPHKLNAIPNMEEYERELITLFGDAVQGIGMMIGIRFENIEEYDEYRIVTATLLFETRDKNLGKIIGGIENTAIPLTVDEIRLNRIKEGIIEGTYGWTAEVVVKGISRKSNQNN